MWILLIILVLIGCVQATINVSSGTGEHDVGPDDEASWKFSKDTQSASDVNNSLSSRVSGIDKSNQEITKNLNKQTEVMKQSRERDRAIDVNNPVLDKSERNKIYKRDR